MTNERKLWMGATSQLGKEGNKAVNVIMRTLSQKQYGGLISTDDDVQLKQYELIQTMVVLFSGRSNIPQWESKKLLEVAKEYIKAESKRLVQLFGEEKAKALFSDYFEEVA
jgi:hypothetical protein